MDSDNEIPNFNSLKISLLTLMGLPGSGKSTLSLSLSNYLKIRNIRVLMFQYDDFVPLSIQSRSIENSSSSKNLEELSIAKVLRLNFLKIISASLAILKSCRNETSTKEFFDSLLTSLLGGADSFFPAQKFVSKLEELLKSLEVKSEDKIVVLVDDNNYYKSMRTELYQIAKEHEVGFCVLYPKVSLDLAKERNGGRKENERVPLEVIDEMEKKLEEPNPMSSPADALCLIIKSDVQNPETLELIYKTVEFTFTNPVENGKEKEEERLKNVEKQRRICAESEVHHADQILRKWVHKQVTLNSFVLRREEMKKLSEDLNRKKGAVLQALKSGQVQISSCLATNEFEFQKEILSLTRLNLSALG